MASILMVTAEQKRFEALGGALTDTGEHTLTWAENGRAALTAAADGAPLMAVIDEKLPDMSGLELVRQLLAVNAWIHTAVTSSLDQDTFHERSEGLGIAACLPPNPSAGDAGRLETTLAGLTAPPQAG